MTKTLKMLDPERVFDDEWEAHVDDLHTFFGDDVWSGDNCGIVIGDEDSDLMAFPGDIIVKHDDGTYTVEGSDR